MMTLSESEELDQSDTEMADQESSSSVCGVPRSKRKVTVARSSLIKRRKQASSSSSECTSSQKQCTTGIDPAWATEFTWMEICGNDGMICTLCRKFSHRPQKCMPGRAVWVDLPCKTIRRASLISHRDSKSHAEAVQMETTLQASRKDGGIERALDNVVSY